MRAAGFLRCLRANQICKASSEEVGAITEMAGGFLRTNLSENLTVSLWNPI